MSEIIIKCKTCNGTGQLLKLIAERGLLAEGINSILGLATFGLAYDFSDGKKYQKVYCPNCDGAGKVIKKLKIEE